MSGFLLYYKSTSPTGRLLARCLTIPGGVSFRRCITRPSTLIRWGSRMDTPAGIDPTSCINSIQAIANASSKWRTLTLLSEAGISVPPHARSRDEAQEWLRNGYTALGRSSTGFGGRDIQVFSPDMGLTIYPQPTSDFYTKFIPNVREYRIHVFRGEVIRIQGKYLDHPEEHTNPYIKNHSQGFRFRTPDVQVRQNRIDSATAAVAALGLDFGAVDLIIGEDGNHYILEVNTAPSCAPMTARAYITKMAEILELEPDFGPLEQPTNEDYARARHSMTLIRGYRQPDLWRARA